jgi:hypothetical protein
VVGFMRRALAFFEARGIEPRRLMSDNAWAYAKNKELARLLAERGIRHPQRAKTPQLNWRPAADQPCS